MDPTLTKPDNEEMTHPNINNEGDDLDDDFFEDEKSRKPKGKKIRKMRSFYDR